MSTQRVSQFYRDLIHLLLCEQTTGLPVLSGFASSSKIKLNALCEQTTGAIVTRENVFRFPENGALFLSRQRVSPRYHDLDLDLVGLVGNFLLVEQLPLLVVEQLLNPIPSSNHVSRKSLEEAEVTHFLSRI